jgi:group II intron reverse transcriptase/maturase
LNTAKPFPISKRQVWEAYKRVKANQGGAGVDGQTIQAFDEDLENNLYKLWNRLASGSYLPPPVKRVEIPKADGGIRPLGIPTVADRIAQMVVKQALEPELEKYFHPDSYGYRPGKSAHQAIGQARRRCWDNDWVVDLDIKGFFDNLDHDPADARGASPHPGQLGAALHRKMAESPGADAGRNATGRTKGTPQGGVISPLLANLFLHYAFDAWMQRTYPQHFVRAIRRRCGVPLPDAGRRPNISRGAGARFADCGLELHPEKTRSSTAKTMIGVRTTRTPLRLSGLHIPSPEIEESLGKVLHQLQSGGQQQGGESDSPGSPKLEPAVAQRQGTGRLGSGCSTRRYADGSITTALLQVGAVPDPEAYRPETRLVGYPQVQASARP